MVDFKIAPEETRMSSLTRHRRPRKRPVVNRLNGRWLAGDVQRLHELGYGIANLAHTFNCSEKKARLILEEEGGTILHFPVTERAIFACRLLEGRFDRQQVQDALATWTLPSGEKLDDEREARYEDCLKRSRCLVFGRIPQRSQGCVECRVFVDCAARTTAHP